MEEYAEKEQQQGCEQQNSNAAAGLTAGGIPNSVLQGIFAGGRKPTADMMGRRSELAPSIAAKMSRAFGMDVASVQVYRSDAMAGSGMQGMASGNKIVLGSDVDLNTMQGQAILGHELSHIRAQSMGLGMGNSGLLQDASLERRADTEGMQAARGMSISGESMGMSMGLGMAGVENLTPLGGGLSASAGAPMQAKKGGDKEEKPATTEKPKQAQEPTQKEESAGEEKKNQPQVVIPQLIGENQNIAGEQGNIPQLIGENQNIADEVEEAVEDEDLPDNGEAQKRDAAEENENENKPELIHHDLEKDPNANTANDRGGELHGNFHKIPLVWEKEVPGDPNAPPEVLVHITQGVQHSDQEVGGHSFMGLEYSRNSKVRGGKKRFRADFGFYPKFDADKIGKFRVYGQNATIPGELKDEGDNTSDISRRYTISNKQAETVAHNAKGYENGGYNLISRNCTTFVADMLKEANINIGNVFKEEDWKLPEDTQKEANAAKALGKVLSTTDESSYLKARMNRPDLRYGVNKTLVTQRDMQNYQTSRVSGGREMHGYGPTQSGEKMHNEDRFGTFSGKMTNSMQGIAAALSQSLISAHMSGSYRTQLDATPKENVADAQQALKEIIDPIEEWKDKSFITGKCNNFKTLKDEIEKYKEERIQKLAAVNDWIGKYGKKFPYLRDSAGMVIALFDSLDIALLETYPTIMDSKKGDSTFGELASNSTMLNKFAFDKAFGTDDKGKARKARYLELASNNKKTEKEKAEFVRLKLYAQNVGAYRNEILNDLDKKMERNADDVTGKQADLDEAFVSTDILLNGKGKKTMEESRISNGGGTQDYAAAMQSGQLRQLFGDDAMPEPKEKANIVVAIHSGMSSLIENKETEVRMVVTSLVKRYGSDISAYQLSGLAIQKIEELYCIPVLRSRSKTKGGLSSFQSALSKSRITQQHSLYLDIAQQDSLRKNMENYGKAGHENIKGAYNPKYNISIQSRDKLTEICQSVLDEQKQAGQ